MSSGCEKVSNQYVSMSVCQYVSMLVCQYNRAAIDPALVFVKLEVSIFLQVDEEVLLSLAVMAVM